LTGGINSLLPGLLNVQIGGGTMGTGSTGILGPYEDLFANTANNFQSLLGGWLADPFPFLRQVGANWIADEWTNAVRAEPISGSPTRSVRLDDKPGAPKSAENVHFRTFLCDTLLRSDLPR
jgi:hypothetical protein